MKRLSICAALLLAACGNMGKSGGPAGAGPSGGNVTLETEDQKTLYALGLALARNTKVFDLTPADSAYVMQGFNDAISGAKPQVDIDAYGPKIQALAQGRMKAKAETEKQKGQATIDAAAAEPGAQKTSSGMVYKSITPGTGPSPAATDTVQVNYEGKLSDGTVFDSSYKRNAPATFPLRGVVPCWTEGLQKMKVGEKAQLTCPSNLAYGDQGHPPNIPGGATLTFTVELLQIMPPAAPGGMPGMPGAPIPGLPQPGGTGGMPPGSGGFHPPPGHVGMGGPPPPAAHPGGAAVPGKAPPPPPPGGKKGAPPPPPHH